MIAAAAIRELVGIADDAARDGDGASARRAFVDAGTRALAGGMRRAAVRCYRRALELDLCDRELVARLAAICRRHRADWLDYARALDARPWPSFACRGALVVVGDLGGAVTCRGAGPVLEVMMAYDDHVDAQPAAGFRDMPLAMAMVILRRALWPSPREVGDGAPASIGVTFAAGCRVRLDELGDWVGAA